MQFCRDGRQSAETLSIEAELSQVLYKLKVRRAQIDTNIRQLFLGNLSQMSNIYNLGSAEGSRISSQKK